MISGLWFAPVNCAIAQRRALPPPRYLPHCRRSIATRHQPRSRSRWSLQWEWDHRKFCPGPRHHTDELCAQSINQSKIHTEPHTGKETPIPALPQGVANPCVTKLRAHFLPPAVSALSAQAASRVTTWPIQDIGLCLGLYARIKTVLRVRNLIRHPTPTRHRSHYCAI